MKKKEFIYNMLKKYGNYTKEDIDTIVTNNNKNTINKLSKKQKEYGLMKSLYTEESDEKRSNKLYSYVKDYIDINVKSFLDFGGASCNIAYFLGNLLEAKDIYCVDINDWMNINFKRRKDVIFMNNMKDIKNKSIDVILVSHTLHHIEDKEIKLIIKEFDRILSDKGILILKEHDSPNKEFSNKLDIQHMIYDTVLTQSTNYDNFKDKFYSNYKSINEWDKLFNKFYILKLIKTKNYDNTYICIYRKISNYFINVKNVNKSKLLVSNVGKYSITHADDSIKISNIIKSYFGKNITITDATANNGGNTISFALTFKNVNSVEIDKKEYEILINNINVYKIKNIKTYNDDYLKIMDTLKQDVVFIDPPWGGKNYKKYKNLDLYLGKKFLLNVINSLKDKCKAIVCKVPFNYNFFSLFKFGRYSKKIHLYIFEKYVVFVILDRNKENSTLENYKMIENI
jgi:predicted RNA methylase